MVDTARRAVAELAASQHRAFTRKQAAELNFDRRRVATALRSGWLAEPVPNVLVLNDAPVTWHQRLMVVVLAAGGHGVASHRSAAQAPSVSTASRHRAGERDRSRSTSAGVPARPGVRGDSSRASARAVRPHVVDGIPCTTSAHALRPRLGRTAEAGPPGPHVGTPSWHRPRRRCATTAIRLHRPHQSGTGRAPARAAPGRLGRQAAGHAGSRSCSRCASTTRRCRRW